MINTAIIKNSNAFKNFERNVKNGAINHAYLLISPDKECREVFFKLASLSIMCSKFGCGVCKTCRMIEDNIHPEIIFADGNNLKVEGIDRLQNDIEMMPIENTRKLVYLENGELISDRSQNKLLKVYEEPPDYLVFFIGASKEHGLIPTMQSRAQKIYLDLLTSEQITKELIEEGIERNEAVSAAAVSSGSLEKARKLCTDEKYKSIFNDTFNMCLNLKKSFDVPEFVYSELFTQENIGITLDFLEVILGDVLKIINNQEQKFSIIGRDFDLHEIAKTFSNTSLVVTFDLIEKARKDLIVNVSSTSLAETILLGMLEAKYKWK